MIPASTLSTQARIGNGRSHSFGRYFAANVTRSTKALAGTQEGVATDKPSVERTHELGWSVF